MGCCIKALSQGLNEGLNGNWQNGLEAAIVAKGHSVVISCYSVMVPLMVPLFPSLFLIQIVFLLATALTTPADMT